MGPTGRLRMCHIRNYCEFDEDTFFQQKAFLQREFFSATQTTSLPGIPAVLWLRDGISFSHPIPTWPLPPISASRTSPSCGGKGLFKEQRRQRPKEELTLSLFREIRHPRPAFILTRDFCKAPKSSLTKSFPNTQPKSPFFSMSQLLLVIQSSALQPCGISFLLYPQIHVDIDALPLIPFYDVFENALSTQRLHFKSCCGLILFCKHFKNVRNQR